MVLPPPGAPPPSTPATSRAVTILVLGIVGLICCNLTAPFAWVMGQRELRDIRLGTAPPQDHAFAQIGMVLGILGTVLLLFGLLWLVAFGGLAAMSVLVNR